MSDLESYLLAGLKAIDSTSCTRLPFFLQEMYARNMQAGK